MTGDAHVAQDLLSDEYHFKTPLWCLKRGRTSRIGSWATQVALEHATMLGLVANGEGLSQLIGIGYIRGY